MNKRAGRSFKSQLDFARSHGIFRDCQYFPCHMMPSGAILDCTFCFCPFYPCRNRIGSGKWIRDKKNRKIWDCQSCDFIHRVEVVSRIFELLYENKRISKIKKIIQREFCR